MLGVFEKGENSMAFPKFSPLKKMFDRGLNKLRLMGALDALRYTVVNPIYNDINVTFPFRQKWHRKLPKPEIIAKTVIDIGQTVAVFIMYFMSILASIFLLILEKIWHKFQKYENSLTVDFNPERWPSKLRLRIITMEM